MVGHSGWASSLALALSSVSTTAFAQQAPAEPGPPVATTSRVTTYDRAYFSPFAPRTALDVISRVPGFQLDLGSTQTEIGQVDVRGFAGVAGNVVINGARPSSKAETLETTLSRIPAQRVVRVELGPGDLFGSDYAGKSQVLNVILSSDAGFDANVTASARRDFTGYVNTNLEGSALIKRGVSTINLSAGLGRNREREEGTDEIFDLPSRMSTQLRVKNNDYFIKTPFASASWALERAADKAIRANIRWAAQNNVDFEQTNRVTIGSFVSDDSLYQRYRNPVLELGGDVTRPLAGGAIKLVGLATRRKRDDQDSYVARNGLLENGAVTIGGFEQFVDARRNETIGRLSWSRGDLFGLSFEAGAEAAYNTLDSAVELYLLGPNGARTRRDLAIDEATVKERRGELYFSAGRNLSSALRVDGGVNYELSKLQVRGDATADRSLRFLKPNLAIDWKPAGGWHARLSARRTVAQLNFYDFISFAELANDRITGGNAELLPQRTWEVRATFDKAILGSGLLKLDLGYDRVSLLQDQILTPEGFSAPGNIGTGKRRFAALTLDAPLQSFGLSGTRLKFNGQLQRTRVLDPISGETRGFSGFFPNWNWEAELRRDSGDWSYGMTVEDRASFTFYRANEIDRSVVAGPSGTAFVEYRPTARTAATLNLGNALNTEFGRDRFFFTPNRSVPEPDQLEVRKRNRHVTIGLTLKQSFGGSLGGGGAAGAMH